MEEIDAFASFAFPAPSPPPSTGVSPVSAFSSTLLDLPQLVLLRQNSLSLEKFSKNGIQSTVHVVVKNQPFLLQIGIKNNNLSNVSLDFSKAPVEARLLYDSDTLKEVDFVKLKPLEYKCHPNDRGDQATVEVKLKVLSSQLEDMFFRIKLIAIDPATKQRIDSIIAISEPIKVVSKPDNIKRKKATPLQAAAKNPKTNNNNNNNNNNNAPKPDPNEFVVDILQKIESTCAMQQQLLAQLYEQVETNKAVQLAQLPQATDSTLISLPLPVGKQKPVQEEPLTEFEKAFLNFVRAYDKLPHDQVPEKIRRAVRNAGTRESENLCQLLETVSVEAQQQQQEMMSKNGHMAGPGCHCTDCPHKRELERIDDFYNEFLCTSNTVPATFV